RRVVSHRDTALRAVRTISGHGLDITLATLAAYRPERDSPAAWRPGRLQRAPTVRKRASLAGRDGHNRQSCRCPAEIGWCRERRRRDDNLLTVWRPARRIPVVRQARDRFTGRRHQEDPAAVPLGSKGYAIAIRGERWLRILRWPLARKP